MMDNEIVLTCPHCGQPDGVTKVSTLYESVRNLASQKTLAKTLAPPPKPIFNFIEAVRRRTLAISSNSMPVLLRLFFAMLMAAFLLVISMVVFNAVFATAKIETKDLIIIVVVGGLLLFFLSFGEEDKRGIIINEEDLETRWEKAMRRWKALYYCASCDCVFFLDNALFAPSRLTRTFLYKETI